MQNLYIRDQQENLNDLQGNLIQDTVYVNWLLKHIVKECYWKLDFLKNYYVYWIVKDTTQELHLLYGSKWRLQKM